MATTPTGRKKNVSGQAKDLDKRGSGLGTGPVGSSSGHSGRPGGSSSRKDDSERSSLLGTLLGGASSSGSSSASSGRGLLSGKSLILIIIIGLVLWKTGLLDGILGGGGSVNPGQQTGNAVSYDTLGLLSLFGAGSSSSSNASNVDISSIFSGSSTSSGWTSAAQNTASLNTDVANSARAKRTKILGNNKDVITIMVYMCGTDLESQYKMGTSDLREMLNASFGSNINLIVYTGGCRKWQVNQISSTTNQVWQVKDGNLVQLVSDAGNKAMTKASTLSEYIQFCKQYFPANRYELIFWDHGGGSLSGYGYDERFASSGSMNLSAIKQALTDGGVTFDFIGFDACLMATAETALMLTEFADYLIGSEETEPGIGWYYTNWLTKLGNNTSMPTLEIGKNIVDDFVDTCATSCAGQKATLSVIDLAELESTMPADFKKFSTATSEQIVSDYKSVSKARSGAREFAASTRIDQVDLVDLANKLGTAEAKALAKTVLSAVKYNRTSSNMTNAYGLSIYFPYQQIGKVDSAVSVFKTIGLDEEYRNCIQAFAGVETGGQATNGSAGSPLSSLLSSYTSGGQSASSSNPVSSILGGLLGSGGSTNYNNVSGLSDLTSLFLGNAFGKALNVEDTARYLEANRFDTANLEWKLYEDNTYGIYLPDAQWDLVEKLELSVFLKDKDGGFIDLGLDNMFEINKYGVLKAEKEYTWLAINEQPVAYYLMDTVTDGKSYTITGRVPALLNGTRVELILVFTSENENGYIAGARPVYSDEETDTVAKALLELEADDRIDFIYDHYDKDGKYDETYIYGEQMRVGDGLKISDVILDQSKVQPCYKFTDIYKQEYWSPLVPETAR